MMRLGLAGIMIVAGSCTSQEIRTVDDLTIIRGVIANQGKKPIKISNQSSTFDASVGKDSFQIALTLSEPDYFKLQYGSTIAELYLVPGQDLAIIESKDLPHLQFDGKSSASNKYLSKNKIFTDSIMPSEGTLYGMGESEFYTTVSKVRDACLDFLNDYIISHHNLDPVFFERERARIWYRWGLLLSNYHSLREYFNQSQIPVSPSYYSFQKELSLDEPGLIVVPEYLPYVLKTLYLEVQRLKLEGNIEPEHELAFNLIPKMISSPLVRDHCYYRVMKNILKTGDVSLAGQLLRPFKQNTITSSLRREVVTLYKTRRDLQPGNRAPIIHFRDMSNSPLRSDDFLGKYLYLLVGKGDCPACMPARRELRTVAGEMKEYPIQFVALSPESDAMKRFQPEHLSSLLLCHMTDDFIADFESQYLVNGVPRAILIGNDGNLINAFAPLPSSHNLRKYLREVLEQLPQDHTFNSHQIKR